MSIPRYDLILGSMVPKPEGAYVKYEHHRVATNAYKTLLASKEAQATLHHKAYGKYFEAVRTLDSEREANAKLTAEVEQLRAQIAALEGEIDHLNALLETLE